MLTTLQLIPESSAYFIKLNIALVRKDDNERDLLNTSFINPDL